ncbi:MAG: coenzyme F420-0:L-glutamate ligase [Candidatus Nitrosocosmicus sp.]|nr:coenzyme F420-0:L-glutamate ligase [Candidatus Nitrosocosmicus sp.]MDN5865877.1 coenzyme F420-0:L-glutamate ligase [Candidatus Nitrosocosmicus sp.]
MISIFPVQINKNIEPNDDLSKIIIESLQSNNLQMCDNDIIVVAQKIVSKSENRLRDLRDVIPSPKSIRLAQFHNKDPRLIELILSETTKIIRITKKHLIVETKHGFICANAGIDQSNVSDDSQQVLLLPENPDISARNMRKSVLDISGKRVSVVIADTFGRPFRTGQTNIAIGIAGITPLKSYIGMNDEYGKKLLVTEIAIADEFAGAAELVMGKTLKTPVAIIRGYNFEVRLPEVDDEISIKTLLRSEHDDLFRNHNNMIHYSD